MSAKRRIIPLFIPHAGCVHDCVFCNQRRISGAEVAAGADEVRQAVLSADASEPTELAFYGGSFTAMPVPEQTRLLDAAQPFLRLNPSNSIRLSTRPDYIDRAIVRRLKSYGVTTIELGAQSMCDDVLCASRRGHSASDVLYASEIIKDAGLSLILQMMTGLPGDTRKKSLHTAAQFVDMRPDGVRIYPTVVVRGTELFEMWQRGDYIEHTVEDAVALCAELYALFEDAKIHVIRLGLNPTDELSAGAAVAGAYHPAFGELVYSRVYLKRAVNALAGVAAGSDVTLGVARGRVSMMVGQRRCNIDALVREFSLRSVRVVEVDVAGMGVVVV